MTLPCLKVFHKKVDRKTWKFQQESPIYMEVNSYFEGKTHVWKNGEGKLYPDVAN